MTPSINTYNHFKDQLLASFRLGEDRMNGEAKTAFHGIRRAALDQFDLLGFPTVRHEEWKYSSVTALLKEEFDLDSVFIVDRR